MPIAGSLPRSTVNLEDELMTRYVLFTIVGLFALPAAVRAEDKVSTFSVTVTGHVSVSPGSREVQVAGHDVVLSNRKHWKVAQLRPYLFHFKHERWNFFWKVNTSRQEAFLVKGGEFGKLGGTETALDVLGVAAVGGSDTEAPDNFIVEFRSVAVVANAKAKRIFVTAPVLKGQPSTILVYGDTWQFAETKPFLFHLRLRTWPDFYWKVNTARQEVYRVKDGTFGELGGTDTKLKAKVVSTVDT